MGILHPGITQSSLILRSEKTTRLSILESDGNLVYLEDSLLGLSQSVVPTGGTGGQVLAKVSGTDYHLEWVDQTGGTGGTGDGTNGTSGTSGINGTSGTSGVNGTNGLDGLGIPSGGLVGQILAKSSDFNYDFDWVDQTGGGGGSGVNGTNGTSGTSGVDGLDGTNGVNGTNGTSGISANLKSINNIFVLGTYSPPLGSTQSTGMEELNLTKDREGFMNWAPYQVDEESIRIPLEWNIQFLGITYSSIYLNSNSYVTFGTSSNSKLASPGMVGAPAIFIAAGDNYLGSIYVGFDPLTDFYRIRFEGSPDSTGFVFAPSIVWEILLDPANPDKIKIVVGSINGNFRNPGGIYGISDGVNWVERITAVPTYDEKTNKMLDSIDIYSIKESSPSYSDSLSSIKFIGPGVYRNLSGTTATINIDPLGQYGLGLNYNPPAFVSENGQTVLSSTRFELLLTTGKDESAMRLRPRGDLFLQPYSRNVDQFGNGFDINLFASNAARDNTLPLFGGNQYTNFDGGSIFITPGRGVGLGSTGSVVIGRLGSNITLIGSSVLAEDYSATFTNRSIVDKEYVDIAVAGAAQSLEDTLTIGNYSGNNDIVMKHYKKIYNEDLSGGTTYATSSIITYIDGVGKGTSIQASPGNVGLSYQGPGATESSSIWAQAAPGQGGVVSISSAGPTYYTFLNVYSGISNIGSYKSSDNNPNLAFKGLEYVHNYSASFVDRSLVDKGYVDNAISGGISGALSGWSGTYTLGDGRTVTVSDGIITGVA